MNTHTKTGLLILAFFFVASYSSCQNNKSKDKAKANKSIANIQPTPKVDIKVNRKYDEKGNLIGFDSTYTSFYSSKGDTVLMDSLFKSFNRSFLKRNPGFLDQQFHNLFFNDTLIYHDFFHDDFFKKRYELNDQYLKKIMKEMDSIKNNFYRELSKTKKPDLKKK